MDSYDNDWLFLDDDLFLVCISVDDIKRILEDEDGMDRVQP